MNRNRSRERLLFTCLLVALIVGIVVTKLWVMGVEQRLADSQEFHWISVNNDQRLINLLWGHESRLRKAEHTAWAVWDNHAPCNGWPTQREIARGE